jgi:hypothetical protein
MTDKSKGRGKTKCSAWSSRLGFGRGAMIPRKNLLLRNHGGDQELQRFVVPVKKKNELNS